MDRDSLRQLREQPGYLGFVSAATLARVSDEMFSVGVVLLVLDRTGSAALAGATVAAITFPSLVSGPLLGAWLDLTGRRRTLMVIDQRPSGIDDEVMSQLGTRITALLNDEKDIDAVFTGIRGGSQLKALLTTLDSKQEVMVMGHAVPMEVVLRVRTFDANFYKSLHSPGTKEAKRVEENIVRAEKEKLSLEDLFGE